MPRPHSEHHEVRAIAHVDMDCFYVQVEQRRRPELKGKPVAVVQYNLWKGGGLIAVGYEARKKGVTRLMRGDEAREKCPEIELVVVPMAHGKADLTLYRDAGAEVMKILARGGCIERASIDECYLDLTESAAARIASIQEGLLEEAKRSHIIGLDEHQVNAATWLRTREAYGDQLLAAAALIIAELRSAVLAETHFTCSAGVAPNKMLAKLASAMHKPEQQTVVPLGAVMGLLKELPIKKIRHLGGKLGHSLEVDFAVTTVGQLKEISEATLREKYGDNTGIWLARVANGQCEEPVQERPLPKSHSCGKTFRGPAALRDFQGVHKWLLELASELCERLEVDREQHGRTAKLLTVHIGFTLDQKQKQRQSFSRSCPLRYGTDKVASDALALVKPVLTSASEAWAVMDIFLAAAHLQGAPADVKPLTEYFSKPAPQESTPADLLCHEDDKENTSAEPLDFPVLSDVTAQPDTSTPYLSNQSPGSKGEGTLPGVTLSDEQPSPKRKGSLESPQRGAKRSLEGGREGGSFAKISKLFAQAEKKQAGRPSGKWEDFRLENVDMEVLSELPEEIRAPLLEDLQRQQMLFRPPRPSSQKAGPQKEIRAYLQAPKNTPSDELGTTSSPVLKLQPVGSLKGCRCTSPLKVAPRRQVDAEGPYVRTPKADSVTSPSFGAWLGSPSQIESSSTPVSRLCSEGCQEGIFTGHDRCYTVESEAGAGSTHAEVTEPNQDHVSFDKVNLDT